MVSAGTAESLLPRYLSVSRAVALAGALLLTVVLWSAFTEVEIVVTAPAAARPVSGVSELRAPDTGLVAGVPVGEGDLVTPGDAVVVFESRVLDAEWRSVRRILEVKRRALADGTLVLRVLEGGTDGHAAVTAQAWLMVREHRSRLAQLDDEIGALESELEAAGGRTQALVRLAAIKRHRLGAAARAFEHGALSRFQLLEARQDALAQQTELDASRGHVDVLQKRLDARRHARGELEAGQRRSLLETVAALELEVAELESRLAAVAERRRHSRVSVAARGVVDQVLVSAGDFVQRGERLAVVVPADSSVVFETRIAPRQAAFLRPGQACRIKLDALPFARYGALPCTVELLGEDVVGAEQGSGHYLARVRPASQDLLADGVPVRLRPGATGWVDIIAGRRTVLSFFTEPLRRFARESLRER